MFGAKDTRARSEGLPPQLLGFGVAALLMEQECQISYGSQGPRTFWTIYSAFRSDRLEKQLFALCMPADVVQRNPRLRIAVSVNGWSGPSTLRLLSKMRTSIASASAARPASLSSDARLVAVTNVC